MALLFLSLSALPTAVCAQQPKAPVVCDGAHFTIEFLPGDLPDELAQAMAKQALEIVEGAWPVFEKALQPKNPTKALLRLHTDATAYYALVNTLLPEAMENSFLVTPDGGEAHVRFTLLSPPALQSLGFPPQNRWDLLFAAGKQLVLRQLGERGDDWLSDLIGVGLAETVINPQRRLGVDLLYDARRVIVVHSDMFVSATDLLGIVGQIKSANDGHALDLYYRRLCLLADQLVSRAANWPQRLIASWPQLPRAEVSTKDRYAPIEALLGKDWKKAQERFEKPFLGAKIPWEAWEAVWRRGDEWILAGSQKVMAGFCGLKQTPATDWTLRCQLQWEPSDEQYCPRVRIDWNGRDSISAQFTPDALRVVTRKHDDVELDTPETAPISITIGQPVDFRVDVVGKRVTFTVNGKAVIERNFPARSMHEAFSFEIGRTVLHVRGIKIEAKPAKR